MFWDTAYSRRRAVNAMMLGGGKRRSTQNLAGSQMAFSSAWGDWIIAGSGHPDGAKCTLSSRSDRDWMTAAVFAVVSHVASQYDGLLNGL